MPAADAPTVAYLGVGPDADAGWQLLAALDGVAPRRIAIDALGAPEHDVLWVHASDEPPPLPPARVLPWLEQGGRLLLTQRAAARVASLGIEPDGPNDVVTGVWRHETDELWFPEFRDHPAFPHIRGIAGFGPHPLLAGLGQGTYLWAPQDGERFSHACYARGRRPTGGAVVGCERSYIHLNAARIVAWEYAVGAGGVLCLGAFIRLAAGDRRFMPQLGTLLGNALANSAIPHAGRPGPVAHWPVPGRTARVDPHRVLPAAPLLDGALPDLGSDLLVSTRALDDAPYSLAGRRALVLGGEQQGVREIWIHPHRVASGWAVTIGGESPLVRDAQITPTAIQRHLVSRTRIVEETLTTALEHPVVVFEYRAEKVGRARGIRVPPELEIAWTTDLRRAWPYGAGAEGDLSWAVAADRHSLVVTTAAGTMAFFAASRPVDWDVRPEEGRPAVAVRLRTPLEEPLRLAVVAGGASQLDVALRALARRGVSAFTERRLSHAHEVRDGGVRLRTPDPEFNTAFEWAKLRLDAFVVDTPGVGRSIVAGYAASRPGWSDGRPGYAWYFGRDGCWTALAHLAAGDFFTPRLVLRMLGDGQDVTGKVFHELTTSGLAHYDAADSTPLYLLLAGRYASWSGDLAFLEASWARIERAYQFCLSTDRDGDGLIENTGVGHGWIEMGPLAGAHVTLYLAGIWVAALEALAPVCRALQRDRLASDMTDRAARARATIDARFRTPDGLALGILADGTAQRRRTALAAVPLLLGAVDPAAAGPWFEAIASPGFSAPWGVRLLPTTDPLYDPGGYHSGAVWPLYTGWVSLAEFSHHRAEDGFAHVAANARLPFARQVGAFDEVLRGDEEAAAGVCPDQAWSAAMLVLPTIEGLLGARPDALAGRLALTPHLPAAWSSCEWRGLRVGGTVLDVRVRRSPARMQVMLVRTAGPGLSVTVSVPLPAAATVGDVRVDELPLAARESAYPACTHAAVTLDVTDAHDVEVFFR